MCSFMVYTKNDIKKEDFLKGFKKIKYRGPDMSRLEEDKGIWGFHRLAIMGLSESGMQPFCYKENKLVCNGEIYGFRKIKKELEKEGYKFTSDSDLEFSEKVKKYDKHKPFTKESLLYREIFEKYYPNSSDLIIDYWMPNKSWEGCDVTDPSARVLKNYGDSGK